LVLPHLSFSNTKNFLVNLLTRLKGSLVDPFIRSHNPPWFDARGVFVGLFIGTGIPLGAQTICLGLFRLALRFNVILALAFTWVNNPITVAPMYYGFYLIGSFVLNKPPVRDLHEFYLLIAPVLQSEEVLAAIKQFLALGSDVILRWFIGAFLTGIPIGLAGYFITLRIQTARATKRASS
jgi:uncharacterized protein (DUF2062 family)